MLPRTSGSLLIAWLLVLPVAARGAGAVEGSIALDEPKPVQISAGYKPETKHPVQQPDRFVAVVYLENGTKSYPPAARTEVFRIPQKGYQFRPSIAGVRTGTRVLFPNQDDEFHNVFSYSTAKRFDLGRFRREDESPVTVFDKPGIVKIYCEIHQHMRCILLVLDTPWFTNTDAQGRFKLTGIPRGDYVLKAFLPSERVIETAVRVSDGAVSQVRLQR